MRSFVVTQLCLYAFSATVTLGQLARGKYPRVRRDQSSTAEVIELVICLGMLAWAAWILLA